MNTITTADFWTAIAGIAIADLLIVGGYLLHFRSVAKDILRDEKYRLRDWARQHAEQLAQEYIRHIHIDVPVALVNESDIDWGDRKDDAA